RDFTTHFSPVGQPEMDRLIEVYNRMIDQLREERLRVREQNELLDRIVEASPGGVIICDFEGRVTQLNPSAESLLGIDQASAVGRTLNELAEAELAVAQVPVPLAEPLASLEDGASRVVSASGGRRIQCQRAGFRDRGFVRSFYLLAELTDALRRSEKAAYEKLIRMMSHEVNNSVGAVGSLLASVKGAVSELPSEERPELEQAVDVAADRLDHLRAFMDGFAGVVRLPNPDLRPCDVGRLIDDLVVLLEPSLAERGIELRREGASDGLTVSLDKNQIEQALVNIVKNAAESIGRDGAITLRSGASPSPDRSGVWIEIEDTGTGIDPEVAEQLFTPFFTTRDDGCGLGLTLVKEVLSRHEFGFSLESVEGGARFRIEM
ncbi:MAG: ATP-binding protein, partial [Acidobacteriota bacterium]